MAEAAGGAFRRHATAGEKMAVFLIDAAVLVRWPSVRSLAAAILVAAGLVLIGQGVYIHAKALLAQVLLERAFRQSTATAQPVKPWSWADTWPVARVAIPRLQASAIVLAGASGQALAFGPGHVVGTAHAGEPGTAVYAAHRDTHFAFLRHVVPGDVIDVTRSDGSRFRFRVTHASVVAWDRSGIDPATPGHHIVLATCWPFEARTPGPQRYLVHAVLEAGPPDADGGVAAP